ncbi:hypothetical protein F5877DRAFT_67837 [Lentinula edodes]|nr:hypothetical protein F5877DRAFT_67837 [Lentinula edodes]
MGNANSRDGSLTTFCERLPLIGYGVTAVQLIEGNPDHAKRAAATSTNAIVTTGGAVLGSMAGAAAGVVAGPPSAAAAQFGMVTEYGIATSIGDAKVKAGVGEISWKRAGGDALIGAFTGAAGGAFGVPGVTRAAGQAGSNLVGNVSTNLTDIREANHLLVRQPNPRQYLNGTVSVNLPTLPTSKQGVTGGHENRRQKFRQEEKDSATCGHSETASSRTRTATILPLAQNAIPHEMFPRRLYQRLQLFRTVCHHERRLAKTYEWMKNEIDWARKLGKNGSIPLDASRFISEASRQFILDELECRTKKGMNWTSLGDYLRVRAR